MSNDGKVPGSDDEHWFAAMKVSVEAQHRAVHEAGLATIRALMLVNGGAVIALLAFSSSLVSSGPEGLIRATLIVAPLEMFAWGVAASVFCAGCTYFSNLFASSYTEGVVVSYLNQEERQPGEWQIKFHHFALYMAVGSGIASLTLFGFGVRAVSRALATLAGG